MNISIDTKYDLIDAINDIYTSFLFNISDDMPGYDVVSDRLIELLELLDYYCYTEEGENE